MPTAGSTALAMVQLERVNRTVHYLNQVFIGVSGSKVCIAVVNPNGVLLCKLLYILRTEQAWRHNDQCFRCKRRLLTTLRSGSLRATLAGWFLY